VVEGANAIAAFHPHRTANAESFTTNKEEEIIMATTVYDMY